MLAVTRAPRQGHVVGQQVADVAMWQVSSSSSSRHLGQAPCGLVQPHASHPAGQDRDPRRRYASVRPSPDELVVHPLTVPAAAPFDRHQSYTCRDSQPLGGSTIRNNDGTPHARCAVLLLTLLHRLLISSPRSRTSRALHDQRGAARRARGRARTALSMSRNEARTTSRTRRGLEPQHPRGGHHSHRQLGHGLPPAARRAAFRVEHFDLAEARVQESEASRNPSRVFDPKRCSASCGRVSPCELTVPLVTPRGCCWVRGRVACETWCGLFRLIDRPCERGRQLYAAAPRWSWRAPRRCGCGARRSAGDGAA